MRVDCHTHIISGQRGVDCSEHLEAAERVDSCVVLAADSGDGSKRANKVVSEYVGKHRDKMVGFGVVDAVKDGVDVKHLRVLKDQLGLSGVVVYCAGGGYHPLHSRAMRLYESAEALGLPVFFHNSGPFRGEDVLEYGQSYLLDEAARRFGGLKMIIGGMGRPFVKQTFCMVQKHANVYADLTLPAERVWEIYNVVVGAYEWGVMDKLLFGSGFPDGDADACTEALLGFNKLLTGTSLPMVPRGSIRNIIERNSLEVLGIGGSGE